MVMRLASREKNIMFNSYLHMMTCPAFLSFVRALSGNSFYTTLHHTFEHTYALKMGWFKLKIASVTCVSRKFPSV